MQNGDNQQIFMQNVDTQQIFIQNGFTTNNPSMSLVTLFE
jgi:hypothetical protein